MLDKLFSHALKYSVSSLLVTVAGFISFPIFTRLFSVAEYGLISYVSSALMVLLAEGVLSSWVSPNKLAFIQASWKVAECVNVAAAAQGPHTARAASASVAPHTLGPSSLG